MDVLADWWDKFATTEVGSVESFSGRETRESADHVASALRAWHEAGAASGDLAFWRERAEQFRSPKAYALVVDALLEQRSPVAAMALLVQWLSQADQIPLAEEDYSFHNLALDWMQDLWDDFDDGEADGRQTPQQRWALARKFLDYLEANAEEYWEVPALRAGARWKRPASEEEDDEVDDLYGAAYEGVTFRGSTEDDIEGEMLEGGDTGGEPTDFELVEEAERIVGRLTFLATLAQLWKLAAVASFGSDLPAAEREPVLAGWLDQADEEPAAASRLARRRLSLPHSAAPRHAGGPGGIRTPPQRQGDAAGTDHRHLRGDGRRRAADPRGHGPPQPGAKARKPGKSRPKRR